MPAAAASALHITSRVWLKMSNLKWVPGTVQSVGDRSQFAQTASIIFSLHVKREEAFSKFAFHFCSIFLRVYHPLCIASMVASDAPAAM